MTSSDDDRAKDLLDALRASWPRPEALRHLAEEYQSALTQALEKLTQDVPNHRLKSVNQPLREAAITLANGYLAEQTKDGSHRSLAEIIDEAAACGSLSDVFLTAGCALNDDACNSRLLDLVNTDVAQLMKVRWGPGKANVVVENLPSHLYQPLKRGFNRGRMRLLDFYGRSSLATWLGTIATHLATDRARAEREQQAGEELPVDPAKLPTDPDREELLRILGETAANVSSQLIESLRATSPQQYTAAILRLRQGYTNAEIAARLGCTKPAVTQLLDKVSRKFLDLLAAADPCFHDVINAPSSKDKKWIEEAVFDLIRADEDLEMTDPSGSPDAQVGASSEG